MEHFSQVFIGYNPLSSKLELLGASGLYTAAPAYIGGDTSSLYTSTPRQQTEHLYDTLQRPDTAIYSTIIN